MIAENAETVIQGKNVFLRLPTTNEAKKFFDSLDNTQNKSLDDRIITFTFESEILANGFHKQLIANFGDPTDPKIKEYLKA